MGNLSAPHILSEQQDSITIAQLAVEAMAYAEDGPVDHNLDMRSQLARLRIPEGVL
jgi:hypothetical protein